MANLDSLLIPGAPRRPVLLDIMARPIITAAGITNITDTFVRGAYGSLDGSATSDSKTTWDVSDGPFETASPGLARLTTADSEGQFIIADELSSANYEVTGTVTLQAGSGFGEWTMRTRYNDANNFYVGGVYYDSGWYLYLGKIVGGVFDLLDDPVFISSGTPAAGTEIIMTCDGTTISVECLSEIISVTDSDLPDGKRVGAWSYYFSGTAPPMTNFEVSTL